jgi:hypothetical protein
MGLLAGSDGRSPTIDFVTPLTQELKSTALSAYQRQGRANLDEEHGFSRGVTKPTCKGFSTLGTLFSHGV